MSVEQFDIVDEHDRPTGKLTTKKEAHENGYPHRVAAVLVFTPSGKILAQEHKLIDRLLDHSVGGHVAAGETYLQAAIRETQEELGLSEPLEEIALGVRPYRNDPRPRFSNIVHFYGVYKVAVPANWKFKVTDEVDSLIEMELDEVIDQMNNHPEKFLNGFFVSLEAYLKKTNYPKKISAFGKNWGKL